MDVGRALADGPKPRPLHYSHVLDRDPGQTGFQHLERACERPRRVLVRRARSIQIALGLDEALVITRKAGPERLGSQQRLATDKAIRTKPKRQTLMRAHSSAVMVVSSGLLLNRGMVRSQGGRCDPSSKADNRGTQASQLLSQRDSLYIEELDSPPDAG
jgi:hypothetical protein